MHSKRFIFTVLAVFSFAPLFAQTKLKLIRSKSEARFKAQITFSQFTGKSTGLRGRVVLDETKNRILSGQIFLPVKSIKTGLKLRDKHMRSKYLEVKKYKNILFKMIPQKYSLKGPFSLKGIWTIHGVSKKSAIPVSISSVKTEKSSKNRKKTLKALKVKSRFKLDIRDFSIKTPKYLAVKMEPVLDVSFDLALTKSP